MQHIYEFIAEVKMSTEDQDFNKDPNNLEKKVPQIINRYFNTQSGRKKNATEQIYKVLGKEPFNVKTPEGLENFYIRQLK